MTPLIHDHLLGVSRTYAIVIPMLPKPLDERVGLAYLLMRIVDTLEDAPAVADPQRDALLARLDAALEQRQPPDFLPRQADIAERAAERALLADAPEVFGRIYALPGADREAILRCARTMIAGVRQMLERSRRRQRPYPAVADAAELREYCYYVAGVVGRMLCELFASHLKRPALRSLADVAEELGIGLQLVNVLKDIRHDARLGRRYVPQTASGTTDLREIIAFVLAEARRSLRRGAEFVLAIPASAPGVRSFCGLPIAWGALTLERIERTLTHAGVETVKISRQQIRETIERFQLLAGRDQPLRAWMLGLLGAGSAATS